MSDYPEHGKLAKVRDQSQAIGEFLEWAATKKGLFFAELGVSNYAFPALYDTNTLLAEFFDIDPNMLEVEKLAMLAEMRRLNEETT